MVDLGTYKFKDLNTGKITSGELFTNAYVKGVYESKHVRTSTKHLRILSDTQYEKKDLHKVMETQFEYMTIIQRNEF